MIDSNHDPKMREFRFRAYHGIPDDEELKAMSDIELDSLLHSSKDNPVKTASIDRELRRRELVVPTANGWIHRNGSNLMLGVLASLIAAAFWFHYGPQ